MGAAGGDAALSVITASPPAVRRSFGDGPTADCRPPAPSDQRRVGSAAIAAVSGLGGGVMRRLPGSARRWRPSERATIRRRRVINGRPVGPDNDREAPTEGAPAGPGPGDNGVVVCRTVPLIGLVYRAAAAAAAKQPHSRIGVSSRARPPSGLNVA